MTVDDHPARSAGRRRRLALGGAAMLSLAVASLWLFLDRRPDTPAEPVAEAAPAPREPTRPEPTAVAETPPPAAPAPEPERDAVLHPFEVLGNLECTMVAGYGAASGTALVVLPTATGARFSVVDGRGAVVGDALAFRPYAFELGRRADGTPVVGLGNLRGTTGTFRPPDTSEPVRIYLGEHVVYKSDKVWDFRVAPDGSSFAVHEPLAGDASRLVVHNLELGTERHFDLGARMTPDNAYQKSYTMNYSLDGTEIVFQVFQADSMGKGTYWFYPAGEGKTRRIAVEGGLGAVLVSSREGYFAEQPDDLEAAEYRRVWQVARRAFDAASGTAADVWRRRLDLERFGGRMFVSDDGRWLGVDGWDFHVLDAKTGDTVFRYPQVSYPKQQLARLASVVGENASAADVGRLSGISFQGGSMRFFRQFGRLDCFTPPGGEYDALRYRQCVRDHRLRGAYRTVYDVYDLDALALDAQPDYRAEIYRETTCMEGDVPFRGLQGAGGRLTYLSSPRQPGRR